MGHIHGTVAAVVLAAGAGSRFGTGSLKPLAQFKGRPLVVHSLDAAVASGLGPVLLVVGKDGDEVASVAPSGIEVVHNPRWATGIASSLHAALMHLADRGIVHACAIGLADQPLVGAEAWMRLGDAYDSGAGLAAATYGGLRGNPVLVGRDLWPEALTLVGDSGARQLFGRHEVVDIDCSDTGSCIDVDTPEELAALEGA